MEGPSTTHTLQALALVGVALYALRAVLRWYVDQREGRGVTRQLRHVESCSLGPKQRLHLVELGDEQLLVAATESELRLLRRRPAPTPVASASAPAPRDGDRAATTTSRDPDRAPTSGEEDELSDLARGARRRPRPAPARAATSSPWWRGVFGAGVVAALVCLAPDAVAQELGTGLPDLLGDATRPDRISTTLELVLLLTLFSIAPSVLLMATCFTRVVIVLALLRQALGVAQLPPNQVIIGLALAITVFAMAPVGAQLEREALQPYVEEEIDAPAALERATATVRGFLLRHTRERDLALFVSFSESPPQTREDVALSTLLPSFLLSEIRTAFEIGFTIFLPFLIVDLVIASMLISMQMIVLPPIVISLPFKLMLFVLLDGWNLVAGSLIDGLR